MAEEKEIFDPLEDADDDSGIVVEFEDEDGEKFYYSQEMVLEVNGENYALLVGMDDGEYEDEPHEHHRVRLRRGR